MAATPLTAPRWVPRADPVLDEREQDDLVFDGQSLSWRPVSLSYLYRDGQFVTLPARADGQLPPPPQLGDPPPLSYQLALQPAVELAEFRFYLASQERLVERTYVQEGWVELQPGVPQGVTTRERLPLLLAWPKDRGPLPAGAMPVAQPGQKGRVVLLSAGEHAELTGALFGRSLFDLEPPPPLAGVKRLTEMVSLGRGTSESQRSANLLSDQRLSSSYDYGLGVTERFDYSEGDGAQLELEIAEEVEPDLPEPEQLLPLASDVTLGSPVAAQIGAGYGRQGWDGPNPDRLRRPPSGLLRVAGPPASGALALLAALGLLRWAWRRRQT